MIYPPETPEIAAPAPLISSCTAVKTGTISTSEGLTPHWTEQPSASETSLSSRELHIISVNNLKIYGMFLH